MKKYISVFVFSILWAFNLHAQKFVTHEVSDGDTIESIAKKYSVTPRDILKYNPDARKKLKRYDIIVIPQTEKAIEEGVFTESKELVGFETHKTKRRETLYGISKKYDVEIAEIKKHNTFLYSSNLRKGDKIKIPKYKTVRSKPAVSAEKRTYSVLPKEGKWRIAYKFDLTVPELEELNPDMPEVLNPGDLLNVPNIAGNKEKKIEDANYNYYTVKKAEGYMALERKLGLTKEDLVKLNPELEENGLDLGQVLRVPKNIEVFEAAEDIRKTKLVNSLTNFKPKNIALMLPYSLHKVDMDSIADAKRAIRENFLLSVSLDFQSGAMIAMDSAKSLGISTNLKVYDTRNHSAGISRILNDNDLQKFDAVIGPLMEKNFERIAIELNRHEIPAISPLTMPTNLMANVYQTVPSKSYLENTIINFANKDSLANFIIISDSKNLEVVERLKSNLPNAKHLLSRKDEDGKEMYYLTLADIENIFVEGKKNIVFLESKNEGYISNITSMINGMSTPEQEIVLMTTDKNNAFDGESISNTHLSNLGFTYPSINRALDMDKKNGFTMTYKSIYGVMPNKYATRGFDIMMDILLRLSAGETLYDSSQNDIETEYVENKFRYSKKVYGGYINESVYIVKYDNLSLVEVD